MEPQINVFCHEKSPLFVLSILSICLMIACKSSHVTPTYIDNTTIQNTIDEIAKSTKLDQDLIVRGFAEQPVFGRKRMVVKRIYRFLFKEFFVPIKKKRVAVHDD
jgi:poly(A) polymerase Pap1